MGARNKTFQFAGTSSFTGPKKISSIIQSIKKDIPGPGDYMSERAFQSNEKSFSKESVQFASNIERFKVASEGVPGPGKYTVSSPFNIRSHSTNQASFKSSTKRELKLVIDKSK